MEGMEQMKRIKNYVHVISGTQGAAAQQESRGRGERYQTSKQLPEVRTENLEGKFGVLTKVISPGGRGGGEKKRG
jgi:hypothetical protein